MTRAAARSGPVKQLFRLSKVHHPLDDAFQPTKASGAFPGTLTDQRGRLVHYEIRMNRTLYDYVVTHGLFQADRQAALEHISAPEGSILIKAAWRELEPGEQSRFYTRTADIWDPDDPAGSTPRRRLVGLVGLHAMQKTASAPQWIWTTYEQIDNVEGADPSFRNPHCSDCLTNRQGPPGFPNQVTRLTPIPSREPDCARADESNDNLQELNRQIQASLPASVWRNYELVGAQWPLPPAAALSETSARQPTTVFSVRPGLLANTTMETYIQTSSSCMGCHAMARSSKRERYVSSDFSFTFSEAYPRRPDPRVVPPPAAPRTRWDRQNWDSILRGYTLSTATYEELPAQVPTARLHCASCHLDAGGNTQASPWLGMTRKYNYPQTQDLQRRINLCFSHSLNGHPLPLEAGEPTMQAFIVYMQWLDEQAKARGLQTPATAFPPIALLSGNAARGQEIFRQKCAFCHNVQGQGRYDDGRYYRPALWGPHSFNRQAGLAESAKMAPFLRANMPRGFGGTLTDQEAWDLASFIDGQERPAGPVTTGEGRRSGGVTQ
ncbi:c-type cytochrome [Vulcanococcus limneticus]|uniref:c-type cytochrome n=1 Tax=Vulcanococcus limneticus TaxID=2170428 RepID=UPI00398C18B7